MTHKEISIAIIEACKNDTELQAFTQATWGKDLLHNRGLDIDRTWGGDDYNYPLLPVAVYDPEEKEINTSDGTFYSMSIHLKTVHKDEYKNELSPVDNVITLTGFDEIEKLADLIARNVMLALKNTDIDIEYVKPIYEPVQDVSNYTEYTAHIEMRFHNSVYIGC